MIGDGATVVGQPALKTESVHAWQVDVMTRQLMICRHVELSNASADGNIANTESGRSEERVERGADTLIVVDDPDDVSLGFHNVSYSRGRRLPIYTMV